MNDCIFCKIASGEIPAKVVFQDDHVFAFHDINPVAPVHILVIPKKHLASLSEADPGDQELLGRVLAGAIKAAEIAGVSKTGFRTVINTGKSAGQSVFHLHAHVIGGKEQGWPP
jgi:histidine triad (HIT) family protein